ncbi:MAG TPA: hypothetical protein DCQ30_07885 [Acidimicrobiaceae bacterium]|nr:hypothetical protein [Acidimicrobiaceae bacterium]
MTADADVYLCESIRQELGHDPSVANLALTVESAGGRLHLMGSVPTEERRQAAMEVATRAAGDREVVNDITVVPLDAPGEPEHLT